MDLHHLGELHQAVQLWDPLAISTLEAQQIHLLQATSDRISQEERADLLTSCRKIARKILHRKLDNLHGDQDPVRIQQERTPLAMTLTLEVLPWVVGKI